MQPLILSYDTTSIFQMLYLLQVHDQQSNMHHWYAKSQVSLMVLEYEPSSPVQMILLETM